MNCIMHKMMPSQMPMACWHSLLLVYPRLEVRLPKDFGFSKRFVHELSSHEIEEGVASFRCFPALVNDLPDHQAGIEYDIVTTGRPLTTLSPLGEGSWWPSPTDVQPEMERQRVRSDYDSVFVYWPQHQFQAGASIPSGG